MFTLIPWSNCLPYTILLLLLANSSGSNPLVLHSLSAVDPRAVCTDGSPGAYYFAPSVATTTAAASTWIIHLEGGGWCYDKKSCAERCPTGSMGPLCSSKLYSAVRMLDGVFRAEDGTLNASNKVFVPYCSSDGHMGNNERRPAEGFRFRGAVIVQAVLRDLVTMHGLAAEGTSHTIVWGGASAGGRGAMIHLD